VVVIADRVSDPGKPAAEKPAPTLKSTGKED
jgi:hypothetical protein